MIKINLLTDNAALVRKTHAAPALSRMGLIYFAILLLAAGGMGTWSFHIHRQVTALFEKRASLRIREDHLSKLKKEIEEHQKAIQQHQNRIDAIEQLKESQTGPLILLNTVIRSIPQNANLWLTSLTQKSGNTRMEGFAQQTEVIPDLMSNLLDSGIFETVDLEEIESQKGISKFSLVCKSSRKTSGDRGHECQ